jgi:hypothetical protein
MSVENHEETPLLSKKPRASSSAWPTMKSVAVGALCVTAAFAGTLAVTGRSSTANSSAALGVPSSAALGVPRINANFYPKAPATATTTVSEVNLAMSHDSGCNPADFTGNTHLRQNTVGTDHGAVTQGVTLEKQYQAGVRVFDLRVADDKHLYHEWLKKNYKFESVNPRVTDLGNAARAANDICIIKFKGSVKQQGFVEEALGANLAAQAAHDAFNSKTTKINDIKGKCFVFNDKKDKKKKNRPTFKAAMNAEKLESSQKRKILAGSGSHGTIQYVYDQHKKKCKNNAVIRAGFTNTGVLHSPLCMSYKDQAAISSKINELLTDTHCTTIFSVDGVEAMIGIPDAGIARDCGAVATHDNPAEAAAEETEFTDTENPELETGPTAA